MINLLPTNEKEKLHREYRLRLTVVGLFLLLLLFFVANILLIPSYILSSVKLSITEGQAKDLKASEIGKLKEEYENTAQETNERVRTLSEDGGGISITKLTRDVAETAGSGVSLSGMLYQKNSDAEILQINGMAQSREDLIAFQERLQALGDFSKVELPVSSLVSDTNINFSMKLPIKEEHKK